LRPKFPEFLDFDSREFRRRILLARITTSGPDSGSPTVGIALRAVSSFGTHVGEILSLGSKEKMIRIDAMRDVAGVADFHPIRNRSAINKPTDLMCFPKSALITEPWIASRLLSFPNPTTIWLNAIPDREMLSLTQ
jgi:hypothetical protein